MSDSKKNSSASAPFNAAKRLTELEQHLAPNEWAQRLKHLSDDLQVQRAIALTNKIFPPLTPAAAQVTTLPPARVQSAAPWQRFDFPGTRRAHARIQFVFNPQALAAQAAPAFVVRSVESEGTLLLLADQITLADQPAFVKAMLVSQPNAPLATIELFVSSPVALARQLRAQLAWGRHRVQATFKQGKTSFQQVPWRTLAQPFTLTLTLPPPSLSRSRPLPSAPKPKRRK